MKRNGKETAFAFFFYAQPYAMEKIVEYDENFVCFLERVTRLTYCGLWNAGI